MAKSTPSQTTGAKHSTEDILRMSGCVKLWDAQPRNQAFAIQCWMTAARRLIILQVYHDGPTNTFEEITTAQLTEMIRASQPA